MKRVTNPLAPVPDEADASGALRRLSETELVEIEKANPAGLSTHQVVELFANRGERVSEATFRKYVQLGLLPRSVRVGRKGKHRGSQGLYPVTVVRQIELVRALMAQGYTIQDIQREFLHVQSDIGALERQLMQLMAALSDAVSGGQSTPPDEVLARALGDARQMATQLIDKLHAIEERLSMRARMARAAV